MRSESILELVRYIFRLYLRYIVGLGQPYQCTLYVYVCRYGGQHVQLERCTTRCEYVYACVYIIWHGESGRCT